MSGMTDGRQNPAAGTTYPGTAAELLTAISLPPEDTASIPAAAGSSGPPPVVFLNKSIRTGEATAGPGLTGILAELFGPKLFGMYRNNNESTATDRSGQGPSLTDGKGKLFGMYRNGYESTAANRSGQGPNLTDGKGKLFGMYRNGNESTAANRSGQGSNLTDRKGNGLSANSNRKAVTMSSTESEKAGRQANQVGVAGVVGKVGAMTAAAGAVRVRAVLAGAGAATGTATNDNQESQAMILSIQRGTLMMARKVYTYSMLRLFPGALAMLMAMVVLTASPAIAGGGAEHKFFTTPQQAAAAMITAVQEDNDEELLDILGPGSEDLVFSDDKVADQNGRAHFLKACEEKNSLVQEAEDRMVLLVGDKDYPFLIPIVRQGNVWLFDTQAGMEEILNRRIGRNELHTIEVMQAYTDAQREYICTNRNDGSQGFAQKFASSEGKKDGLYWQAEEGEAESPFGPLVARATEEGYESGLDQNPPEPFYGYYFKILKGQGEHADGGAYEYLSDGKMVLGFALVAYPAEYGASGIMTFIINQEGVIYEKDLGGDMVAATAMTTFDPDDTWRKYEEPAEQ